VLESPAIGSLPPPQPFTFTAESGTDKPKSLELQLVRFGTPRLVTIRMSGLTNVEGLGPSRDCMAFGEAIG
jgi:hypothetical protein